MWVIVLFCAAMIVLLINGLIQQEHFRLWQLYQDELADKRRAQVAEQKRAAADKIKEVLRQRRAGADVDVSGELNAAIAEARGGTPVPDSQMAEPQGETEQPSEIAEPVAPN